MTSWEEPGWVRFQIILVSLQHQTKNKSKNSIMKSMRILFTAIVITGIAFLSSCNKTEDNTPTDLTPSINFVGGTGYVSGNVTLTVNEQFKVGINAFSNATSGAKLTKLTITRIFNNQPLVQDTAISTTSLNINIFITANSAVGSETFYFKVTDKDNQSKEISLTVTTKSAAGPINEFDMKILGSYDNSTGSSFASIDGTIYTMAQAIANAAKIDWLYFYGSSAANHATIASPKDADAQSVYPGIKDWSVKNNTLFKKVTDVIDWNSITDDAIIVAQTASGVTETKINQLAVNDMISFITVTGKKGMIKVDAITGTTAGTITISVKVQQ
jgi:hypothetical protein